MALTDKLKAIADAIRSKAGTTDTMTLDQMPDAITNLPSGGSGATEPYIEETIDKDGYLIEANLVGYTIIRYPAFYNCNRLVRISLPSSITSISSSAFYGCNKLPLTSLPSGITSIGHTAFRNCKSLALTSLPSGITIIRPNTFYGCSSLALTSLPSGITSIDYDAFHSCTSLTSITFEGTPENISSSAFQGCTNLKTINVPWSEGAVTNAPWGATNATINYDYTGE